MEYADTLKSENEGFSESAVSEVAYMREHIEKLFDRITARMEENHIIRLNKGICTALVGSQYMSLASNSERVADHFINVGKMVREW